VKRSKVKQEVEVKLSVMYARILNTLATKLTEDIKNDAQIEMLAGSQVEKSSKITKRLMYNGIVEDPDKIGDKIRTLMKEKLLGNENLKQYLSE